MEEYVADVVYNIQPDQGPVTVTWDISIQNNDPQTENFSGRGTNTYYYDSFTFPLLAGASTVEATSSEGAVLGIKHDFDGEKLWLLNGTSNPAISIPLAILVTALVALGVGAAAATVAVASWAVGLADAREQASLTEQAALVLAKPDELCIHQRVSHVEHIQRNV